MKNLERRIRALEQEHHVGRPGIVIIAPRDPIPDGARCVIIDDIPRPTPRRPTKTVFGETQEETQPSEE